MSKGKSYNRIVFLTTLSVYLGLVLVSGTACNISHSALTKSFDIKNEIEFKDDFDNNPDKDIPALFADLIKNIKENAESGKINLPVQDDFSVYGTFTRRQNTGSSGISLKNVSDQNLGLIIQNAINRKLSPKAIKLADYNGDQKIAKIALSTDSDNLSLKVSFDKKQAANFAEFLNNQFSSSAKTASDTLLKQVYENTKVNSENNQVFIVTHLPRGSIDSLLAKND
jgi:hypothetical protein